MFDAPHPDPPQPAYFDAASGAWILSKYADVMAALQSPQLWPVGGGERQVERDGRDEHGRLKLRSELLARFSSSQLAHWRVRMEQEALRTFGTFPAGQTVDLLSRFALPWGLTLAMAVTGACPADRDSMGSLGTRIFAATGRDHSDLAADAAKAVAELQQIFERDEVPMGEPTFVALSQTTPRLLANAWLALAAFPDQYARLRAQPDLMPGAVEELLRYGGIVRRVFRRAIAAVQIGGVAVAEGNLLALMLASANRDPLQFPDPNRLDLARPIASQVSLGHGRNSCVGAMPVRMAISVATGALVSSFSAARLEGYGPWSLGSGFSFPSSVDVTLFA